ncbi:MAG: DUF86 domain-containing protein [Clostridia bacterium]|jgi:uncharacterized protein with HEPN domain|nr:DUF86 domain-containing protein [Clostridia bacterium]MDH7572564.1 DUF86 domain-containing protein [Clostridia bacterium]
MKRDDTVYLQHITEAIEHIREYLAGVTKEEFLRKPVLQDAVVRRLEIIGEAGRNISEKLRAQWPEIPWTQIIALRNRIVHDYFNLDLDVVWEIVQEDLALLGEQVQTVIKQLKS